MKTYALAQSISLLMLLPIVAVAQIPRDAISLQNWQAPLYWQPSFTEEQASRAKLDTIARLATVSASDVGTQAQTPPNSLVFVGMTPCRVVDTRTGSGFTGAFGPPSLVGGAKRTFPIQSSTNCSIPSIAQAYSFNITIVPPGFVDFVTVGPTPVSTPPTFSTLNGYVCAFSSSPCVISNAAIVPAGTNGSVDVYASQNTNLIIDINGYYASQSGITLAQGNAGAPSMSFTGDPGTGIFSSGTGTLNIATNGTDRLSVLPNGDLELRGSIRKFGNLFLHDLGDFNTAVGLGALAVNGGGLNTANGYTALSSNTTGADNTASGAMSLRNNTTGFFNTANGFRALYSNTTGSSNTASGVSALNFNTIGGANTASGYQALSSNTTGDNNTASGAGSLNSNKTGFGNTATGLFAGYDNVGGSNNTFIGLNADVSSGNLTNATAIGAFSLVTQSNSLVLGSIAGVNNAPANTNVGIGTTAPDGLQISVPVSETARAVDNVRLGVSSGTPRVILEDGDSTTQWELDNSSGRFRIFNPGFERFSIDTSGRVGIGAAADMTLTVNGDADKPGGGSWSVFSDERLKNINGDFTPGLNAVMQLQPLRYEYKADNALNLQAEGEHIGFTAQAVQRVIPEAVTKNDQGYLLINNDPIMWAMLNAIKEQQAEIEEQQEQNRKLEARLAALEKLLSTKTSSISGDQ